ncbi:MAG: hypothetical protein Q8K28_13575 [Hoeflea sp.]|uniref:hypothetical protein n=1 Tax=Hoeflea sp. TaxID=1940281 RepID=UPI00272FE96D|nr:hypothetical protein [Hoeflea sp.]MDP2120924.1 hypothetical protein [Hoeflea sp.]
MGVDSRAIIAAGNNADLYAAMFASRGLDYQRLPYAFVGLDLPPPYYSNLTVLAPGHADEIMAQLGWLATKFTGAIGLKDSFGELELQANGFETLFGASWIWRDPGLQTCQSGWERIESEADLELWEAAWNQAGSPSSNRLFAPGLLDRKDIVFLGYRVNGAIEAGCIANISEKCIGLSNVFARAPSQDVFAQAAAAVACVAPHLPIAGYESGDDICHALKAGFLTVGDLRILVAKAARF